MTERLDQIEAILEPTAQRAEAIVTELREIRSEIRGLRSESESIIKHLFGRQEKGE